MKDLKALQGELSDRLDLPEDVLMGAAKASVTAGRRLLVENHRGVLSFSAEQIVISLGRGRLRVSGSALGIKAMNRVQLLIAGRVQTVEWE